MKLYFAPLEGITDSVYRRLHHKYFPGADRYYTPFFSPTVHRALTAREQRELPPAAELPVPVIPQILTKNAEDFIWFAGEAAALGYSEVNLNLGCPSGTVVSKGKGAGMLRDPDALDRFLEAIYKDSPLPVSIKSRLGLTDPEEFPRLLEIFNRYPVCELTLHPRVRAQFYKGEPDLHSFAYCYDNAAAPVCYNGNLFNRRDMLAITDRFPSCSTLMLGRGLVADPGLCSGGTKRELLAEFSEELLQSYIEVFGSERNAMFRLKENWHMLLFKFEDSEKLGKRLRKTTDVTEFRSIIKEILETLPMRENVIYEA